MKELIRNKNVFIIWISRALSRFGDSVEDLAQMFLITNLTHSATKVGIGMLLSAIPNIIFSPIAGVIVDRYNKKKLMFICECIRAISLMSVTALMVSGVINIWHIYLMIIINSIAESFYEPCVGVVTIQIAGKENLPIMNSLMSTTNALLRTAGYAVAGILMVLAGLEILFFIDGITFVVSAISAVIISIPKSEEKKLSGISDILVDLKSAVIYIRNNKIIPILLLAYFIINTLIVPVSSFIPQLITIHLHLNKNNIWCGLLPTIFSAMVIVGQLVYPILEKQKINTKTIYLVGFILCGGAVLASAFRATILFAVIMFVVVAFSGSIIMSWSGTELSRQCDIEYLGRVSSLTSAVMLAGTPLAASISGVLIDTIPMYMIFLGVGFILIVSGIILFSKFSNSSNEKLTSVSLEI